MANIVGTPAGETLNGTPGNDTITGLGGNDTALMGAGNDRFIWNPGHGSDTVEGQTGIDTLEFNASAGSEIMALSANGVRALLTRNVGNIVMDLNDVERIELQALAGSDTITVNDLKGTDVKLVAIDLGAGDGAVDTVTRNATNGNDTINVTLLGGAVSIAGLSAQVTIANAEIANDSLVINGLGGNDKINASTLPAGTVKLTIDGGDGNDTIGGDDGSNILLGGDGNDTVTGNGGDDVALLGAGNDVFVWNPGDGSDTVEGEGDIDTLRFIGSGAPEIIDISANGGRALLLRNIGNITMDLNDVERLQIQALGGADTVVVNDLTGTDVTEVTVDLAATVGGAAPVTKLDTVIANGTGGDDLVLVSSTGSKIVTTGLPAQVILNHADKTDVLTIEGGIGNDVMNATGLAVGKIALLLSGGSGNDFLVGSAGNDTVAGGDGNDVALLGAGNDLFKWSAGGDNDTIEGQAGTDTLDVQGVDAHENIDISANGGRVKFFRDIGVVTLDVDDVERIVFHGEGGIDNVIVNDLTGTDVKLVAVDLAKAGVGDGAQDIVAGYGTAGNDKITVALVGGDVTVIGLAAQIAVSGAELGDTLLVNGAEGNDIIDASKLPADILGLFLQGDLGNDTIIGSLGADTLTGGDGDDTVTGNDGDDEADLGIGNDVFVWNPGDGSDTVDGGNDIDTLRFIGAATDDTILVSTNATRVRVERDVANLDIDNVERIEVRALGGADTVTVDDLAGTDATEVAVDLAATSSGKTADTKIDTVTVNATAGADSIAVDDIGSKVVVTGPAAQVSVDHAGKADRLFINGGGDDDVINASTLGAGLIDLRLLGGLGADLLVGSAGNDTVTGGDGDDAALLGAGDDRFIWGPGDDNDTIEGQTGVDTLEFNGANASENFDISANGGRVRFIRDVASVTMDLNDVERIQLQALGGFDNITINDLSGTDLKLVAIDLAGTIGGATGDGKADSVTENATAGNDVISIGLAAGDVSVTGLAAQVTIAEAEIANDRLLINGLGGDDKISAAALPAATIQVTLDGGIGNDTLTGNAGNNFLIGGDGNDTLNGGAGNDTLNGEDGKDTINGGAGNDTVTGGLGDDTINVALGNDIVRYTGILDGHDLIVGFDGNGAGGQDTLDLDALFDDLGVADIDRAGRVSITDNGASVEIAVDTDGNASFDLAVATLKTADVITVGQDVLVGAL
jgi:Ca2+-binding RTX toxin-like protein